MQVRFADEELLENMTLHFVMTTSDGGLVWVTDDSAQFTPTGRSWGVQKVVYRKELNLAYGFFGDFLSVHVAELFAEKIISDRVDLNNPRETETAYRTLVNSVLPDAEKRVLVSDRNFRGNIFVTFGSPLRVYQASAAWPPICMEIKITVAGDAVNPARLFIDRYFKASGMSTAEALRIGVHAMRIAKEVNSGIIGEPVVWVYQDKVFRQLADSELGELLKLSHKTDQRILEVFRDT
jgi:hypothetical protein